MIGRGTVSERPVTLAEVLEILEKMKKEREELGYEQRLAYDYAQKFSKLKGKEARELVSELMGAVDLRENQAVLLVDLMPETKEEVELILAKERRKLSDEEIKKVLDLLNKRRE